jgi:hypothetical protein
MLIAQSPVIKRMLSNNCDETKSKTIEIDDFPASIVSEFVNWLYRGNICDDFDSIEDLFAIADKYSVVELKVNLII